MGRSIGSYSRPKDLPQNVKDLISEMFFQLHGTKVTVDFDNETISVYGVDNAPIRLKMEALGKMFGIMQQYCVTVRRTKKESQISL